MLNVNIHIIRRVRSSDFKTINGRFYIVFSTFKYSESMVNSMHINSMRSKLSWNITRREALSPVVKYHHSLESGFISEWVILILIKCFSVNQNQLFFMKV